MCAQPFMRNPSGKIRWSTKLTDEERLECTPFPCGCCLPCRINKARTWTHRIMLETQSHESSLFVTLTYNDLFLPRLKSNNLPTLKKSHLQSFLKRLRRRLDEHNRKIRYFAVGEYGDKSRRPHYHLVLFGCIHSDGELIERSWKRKKESIGHVHIGTVTAHSARYVSGYTIKKLTSPNDERLDGRSPEFMLSSRKNPGGIGLERVLSIAENLKKNEYFDIDQIINSFKIGGKSYPLGGYLSEKLMEALGVPRETREKALWDYQQKIFNENSIHDEDYYFNLISQGEQKRKILDNKHKLYTKDKIL